MGQWPRMAAWLMHWYSAVSRAARCLQENFTALYLLCACSTTCHAAVPSCDHSSCGSSNTPAARLTVLPHSLRAFMVELPWPHYVRLALVRECARPALKRRRAFLSLRAERVNSCSSAFWSTGAAPMPSMSDSPMKR